jgi:hypothetical protein
MRDIRWQLVVGDCVVEHFGKSVLLTKVIECLTDMLFLVNSDLRSIINAFSCIKACRDFYRIFAHPFFIYK